MLIACNRGMGGDVHFPDICKTPMPPPVVMLPLPYPNLAFNMMAMTFSLNVFWSFMPALNMASRIAMSTGDEPGAMGGLISGIIKGMASVTMGNPIVAVNGMPAKHLLCPTSSNNYNAMAGLSAIPSLTNVFLTQRPSPAAAADSNNSAQASQQPPRNLRAVLATLTNQQVVQTIAENDGVLLLQLKHVALDSSRQLYNQLQRLPRPARAVIIDMRGNPGGDANAALQLCDDCLPCDAPLGWRVSPQLRTPLSARQEQPYTFALAILIDEMTASAAELFAGVLQAHGRARLFGRQSWGKGRYEQLGAHASGKAEAYEFLLPDGSAIEGVGITPDVQVAQPAPDAKLDAALDAALAWSKQQLRDNHNEVTCG